MATKPATAPEAAPSTVGRPRMAHSLNIQESAAAAAGGSQASVNQPVAGMEAEEVDPIAEADVYMAYGRDAQAEEILKESLQKDSNRVPVHAKLLEIYAKRQSLDRPEVREFVRFYLDPNNAGQFIDQVGYVPFPAPYYERALQRLNAGQTGTVFGGQSSQGVGLDDLFRTPQLPGVSSQ